MINVLNCFVMIHESLTQKTRLNVKNFIKIHEYSQYKK